MRCRKTDKLPWGYNLCFLPKSRKMFLIAGHQIVRTRSIRTLHENIVRRISCYFKPPGRGYGMTVVLDELQQLQPKTLSDPEFGAGKHFTVFRKDGMRDIEASRFGDCRKKGCPLEAVWFEGGGNQNVSIDDQAHGQDQRLFFSALAALMT